MAGKDLLFLSHRIPFPPNKGDKIRAHAIINHLSRRYRIHLACHVDDPSDLHHCETLREMLGGECLFVPLNKPIARLRAMVSAARNRSLTEGYFHSPAMGRWIKDLVLRRGIEKTLVFGSAMVPYILDEPGLDAGRCVLDLVDIDSDKWFQYAKANAPPKRWLYAFEAHQLARLERKAARAFGKTVLVSPFEASTFMDMAPESARKIHSICNGVDLSYFNPDLQHPSPFSPDEVAIVMTGQMDYWPNVHGAEWFAKSVFPRLAAQMPRARFYVVGANPPPGFLRSERPKVVVTGRVADVRPYLAHADAVVAPLLIARGVQNKVLEAMAMARPVVATTAATRALSVTSGVHLSIADDPIHFAEAVTDILRIPGRNDLGLAGQLHVKQHHDWNLLMTGFESLLDGSVEMRGGDDRGRSMLRQRSPVTEQA